MADKPVGCSACYSPFLWTVFFWAMSALTMVQSDVGSSVWGDISFDMKEANEGRYSIDISDSPLLESEIPADSVFLRSEVGQRFSCKMPAVDTTPVKKDVHGADEGETAVKEKKVLSVEQMLVPLNGTCIQKTIDWWTYLVCFGKKVEQFHLEGPVVGQMTSLGSYDHQKTTHSPNSEEVTESGVERFHSQWYTEGSVCDVTGKPRQAVVRFICDHSGGDFIDTVREPETCLYDIQVRTLRVCYQPGGLTAKTGRAAEKISCSPVLTDAQYTYYLSEKEKEAKRHKATAEKDQILEESKKDALSDLDGLDSVFVVNSDSTIFTRTFGDGEGSKDGQSSSLESALTEMVRSALRKAKAKPLRKKMDSVSVETPAGEQNTNEDGSLREHEESHDVPVEKNAGDKEDNGIQEADAEPLFSAFFGAEQARLDAMRQTEAEDQAAVDNQVNGNTHDTRGQENVMQDVSREEVQHEQFVGGEDEHMDESFNNHRNGHSVESHESGHEEGHHNEQERFSGQRDRDVVEQDDSGNDGGQDNVEDVRKTEDVWVNQKDTDDEQTANDDGLRKEVEVEAEEEKGEDMADTQETISAQKTAAQRLEKELRKKLKKKGIVDDVKIKLVVLDGSGEMTGDEEHSSPSQSTAFGAVGQKISKLLLQALGNVGESRKTERQYNSMSQRYKTIWPSSSDDLSASASPNNQEKTSGKSPTEDADSFAQAAEEKSSTETATYTSAANEGKDVT